MQILFEDNHLLVVIKPGGVPTQGDRTGDISLYDQAKAYLIETYQKPGDAFVGLVHRLDRPVNGIVILAKTSKAASRLSEQFRSQHIKKYYTALLSGELDSSQGELTHYISSGPQNKARVFDREQTGSKMAKLKYRVLGPGPEAFPQTTKIEIELITGRKHQIRAQWAHMGLPLVGDRKYGSRVPLKSGRIALTAHRIECFHPVRKESMVFQCSLPETWPRGGISI